MTQAHEGPWPRDPTIVLECDDCGTLLHQLTDRWRAFANPYGPWGWTLLCHACDLKRQERIELTEV